MIRRHFTVTLLVLAFVMASSAFAQTPPYNRTVIVPSTGVPATDGAALLSAIAGLSPTPSPTDRWVIQLEGGIYDVGTTQVVLQPYLSLVGAGVDVTTVRGGYDPLPLIHGGLVMGASNSEIRDLEIECLSTSIFSNPSVNSCQALSLYSAHARLTDLRIVSKGPGTANHWGIRIIDSSPILDQVEINVSAPSGFANYGIVYAGEDDLASAVNIRNSRIVSQNAGNMNVGVLLKGNPLDSAVRDTVIYTASGELSAGVLYLESASSNKIEFDGTTITSYGSTKAVGIGASTTAFDAPRIFYRHGSIYGSTHGVDHSGAQIYLVNTEVYGQTVRVLGNIVRIGGTWLRGTGTITGGGLLVCAGTFNNTYTFYPSTCPP